MAIKIGLIYGTGWSISVNGNYIHRKTNHGGYSFHGVYPLVGGLEHGWIMTFPSYWEFHHPI